MKKLLFPCLLGLAIVFSACERHRDCTKEPNSGRYALTAEAYAWLADSSHQQFTMAGENGINEPWGLTRNLHKVYTNLVDFDACLRYDSEYDGHLFQSAFNRWEFEMRIRQHPEDFEIEISFRGYYLHYFLNSGKTENVSTQDGPVLSSTLMLDSVEVRGKTYFDVLLAGNANEAVEIRRVWIAKGVGLIKFEERDGKIWERLP